MDSSYEVSVNETFVEGGYLQPEPGFLTLSCNQSNSSGSVSVIYMLMAEDFIPFAIDLMSGEISVTEDLDYETETLYTFTAVCYVESNFSLNDTASVVVSLLPVNEYRPVISKMSMFVPIDEFVLPGLLTSTLPGVAYNISDLDQPPDEIYHTLVEVIGSYTDALVYNETLSGIILTRQYDREFPSNPTSCLFLPQMQFRVTVCDTSPPNKDCPNIILSTSFVPSNDNNPTFSQSTYFATVPESAAPNSTLLSVSCSDEDICQGNFGGMEITDTNPTNTFSVDSEGNISSLSALDYEREQFYLITVRCYDSATPAKDAFATVHLQLTDVNDNTPMCSPPPAVSLDRGTHQLTPVLRLSCTDQDKGINGQLTFRVEGELPHVPGGRFLLNHTTGQLSFTGNIQDSTEEFNFTIVVSDRGSAPLSSKVGITVRVVGGAQMPMLIVIVVCVVGGLLLVACIIIICCCCCFCVLSRKKKMTM